MCVLFGMGEQKKMFNNKRNDNSNNSTNNTSNTKWAKQN